ncbi:polyadenylate-binding protein RBP45A-like [Papaver somniferum]|uniref:polyadenylate-binding protein RBP45A-like n=1 Tax=Papaver somniferum TaxID=3469 RepID=UPI000E6FE1B3|nr:polyadenylate-binding protein RBP45A-like [Papaver somniferum]
MDTHHGQQSQKVNNPTSIPPPIQTGGLTERIPLTLQQRGIHHYPADPSFLSSFINPSRVLLDSFPPENEESYAKGWYSGFIKESQAAGAESSEVSDRNNATGQSESYGSIEFNNHGAADEHQDDSHEFSVIVANLAAEVTDYVLEETFKVKHTSVKGAKVVTDRTTGRSKGYEFVRFAD